MTTYFTKKGLSKQESPSNYLKSLLESTVGVMEE